MQSRAKVTSKGQVTLRRELLQHFGVRPGDTLIFDFNEPRQAMVRPAPNQGIERLFGSLKPPKGTKLTLDEIGEIIAKGWVGEL